MSKPRGTYNPQPIAGDPEDRFAFPALIEDFLKDRAVVGYAHQTIRTDRVYLAKMAAWFTGEGVTHPGDVTAAMMEQFQQHLHDYRKPDGRPLLLATQAAVFGSIRQFFRWAVAHDRVARDPTLLLHLPRREQRLPRAVLTVAEAELVMDQPDVSLDLGLRDRALLELLYSTGIRRGEAHRLELEDVDPGRAAVMIRQAKGRKDRVVPVGARALSWMDAYLRDARPALKPKSAAFFVSSEDGLALTPGRMTQIVRACVESSGISKRGGCHMFRHTVATLMLESGADIRHVQAMLGHSSLNSTQIYTHVSMVALHAVHARTFPDDPEHDPTRWPSETQHVTRSYVDERLEHLNKRTR